MGAEDTQEAVRRLQRMLRFDTTNPPGDELGLAVALGDELGGEGLEVEVIETSPGRGNLVARLRGDGSERPLLFLSHLDVVPAEPAKWTHPPFGGKVADAHVWGRGAIDSKLTGAVQIQAMLAAKRAGLELKRDIVLVAAADEEVGGTFGVKWLAENRPDVFDAEYGINEAGGFALMIDGKPLYTCQVAEKGSAPVDIVASGKPGHSSVPHGDNAIVKLGAALKALGERKLSHRPPPAVVSFFETAAAHSRPQVAELLLAALEDGTHEEALAALPVNEPTRLMLDAMLRNTCAPTMVEAGLKRNVIPSEARAALSGRPLPGVTEDEFMREVRGVVGEDVTLEMTESFRGGVAFDHETPLFDAALAAMRAFEPDAALAPYMQTGGTDARFLAGFDMQVYGLIPMRAEPGMDFFDLCHGHNERVSVSNVSFAVEVLGDLVRRVCA